MATVSTYDLAEEAYQGIKGYYDAAGLTPPNPATPTYGGMATAVRSAFRVLNAKKARTYVYPTTVAIDDTDADDFKNLLMYYSLTTAYSTLTSTATDIQVGPIRTKFSSTQMDGIFGFLMRQVADLLDLEVVGVGRIKQAPRLYDWARRAAE